MIATKQIGKKKLDSEHNTEYVLRSHLIGAKLMADYGTCMIETGSFC